MCASALRLDKECGGINGPARAILPYGGDDHSAAPACKATMADAEVPPPTRRRRSQFLDTQKHPELLNQCISETMDIDIQNGAVSLADNQRF